MDGSDTPSWLTPDADGAGQTENNRSNDFGDVEMTKGAEDNAVVDNNKNSNDNSNATAAGSKSWGEFFGESFQRDGRMILITILILVLMNVPLVRWSMYPFLVFTTWIHECCHGMAAILVGGKIDKLEIFPDTSGLAHIILPNANRWGFVASAGYQGTAVIGFLLLIVRRTKRGPRSMTFALACSMLLSVMLWVRNWFGVLFTLSMGLLLMVAVYKLNSKYMRDLYVLLSATVALNAIASARVLFGDNHQVNGQDSSTDAHTMADITGRSWFLWATIWFVLALVLFICGFLFAIPGPDEAADFTLCGVCQDMGVFKCCNMPGRGLWKKFFGGGNQEEGNNSNTTVTNNSNNNNGQEFVSP